MRQQMQRFIDELASLRDNIPFGKEMKAKRTIDVFLRDQNLAQLLASVNPSTISLVTLARNALSPEDFKRFYDEVMVIYNEFPEKLLYQPLEKTDKTWDLFYHQGYWSDFRGNILYRMAPETWDIYYKIPLSQGGTPYWPNAYIANPASFLSPGEELVRDFKVAAAHIKKLFKR